jgi:hypothetical protein
VKVLELDRAAVVERGMTPAGVVEGFDPLEDRDPRAALVVQGCRSSSSRCMVDQKDSIMPLSTLEATRPIDPSKPAVRSRCPKIQDVY